MMGGINSTPAIAVIDVVSGGRVTISSAMAVLLEAKAKTRNKVIFSLSIVCYLRKVPKMTRDDLEWVISITSPVVTGVQRVVPSKLNIPLRILLMIRIFSEVFTAFFSTNPCVR